MVYDVGVCSGLLYLLGHVMSDYEVARGFRTRVRLFASPHDSFVSSESLDFVLSRALDYLFDGADIAAGVDSERGLCICWHTRSSRVIVDVRFFHCSRRAVSAAESMRFMTTMPNKSPEPTPVGAGSSAARSTVFGPAWLSFFR